MPCLLSMQLINCLCSYHPFFAHVAAASTIATCWNYHLSTRFRNFDRCKRTYGTNNLLQQMGDKSGRALIISRPSGKVKDIISVLNEWQILILALLRLEYDPTPFFLESLRHFVFISMSLNTGNSR